MSDELTLLLVEDDETTRELLTLMLGAEGWQVREASEGDDALRIVLGEEALPAVILSDLRMPGLSGTAMANAIREAIAARAPAKAPLVIAMTATVTDDWIPAGFDDLLVKPFLPEELLRRCQALWSSNGTTKGNPSIDAINVSSEDSDDAALDPGTFQRLHSSMATEQLRALYEFALADAETRMERMRDAAAGGDDQRFRSEAHAMKGSFGMIGASRLRDLASHAEVSGMTWPPSLTGSKHMTEFTKGIAQIRHILERLLPR